MLAFEWGRAADPAAVRDALAGRAAHWKAVLLTHNETSTAVTNPIAELAATVKAAAPGSADPRRRDQRPRRGPLRDRRLGPGRGGQGLAEGWMVAPGLRCCVGLAARVGGRRSRPGCRGSTSTSRRTGTQRRSGRRPGPRRSRHVPARRGPRPDGGRDAARASGAPRRAVRRRRRAGLTTLGFQLLADPAYASDTVTAALDPDGPRLEGVQRQAAQARPDRGRWPGRAQGQDVPGGAPRPRHASPTSSTRSPSSSRRSSSSGVRSSRGAAVAAAQVGRRCEPLGRPGTGTPT